MSLVPALAAESFAERVAKRCPAPKGDKKVAFFAGCVVNFVRPDLGESLLTVLERQGVGVTTFADEACCGIPVLQSGDEADARAMARHNVKMMAAQDFEHLVFVCPTCATTAKHEWPRLLAADPQLAGKARELAEKAMDISTYLAEVLAIAPPENAVPAKVTYHDPCHLANAQGIKSQPRQLLQRIPGVQLVEMAEANRCCGGSGTYSITHYDLSMKILDHKMDNAMATGAEYLATCCPSCMMQLQYGVKRHKWDCRVVHPIELVYEYYQSLPEIIPVN